VALVERMDLRTNDSDFDNELEAVSSIPVLREASIMRVRSEPAAPGGYVFDQEVPIEWFGAIRRGFEHGGKFYGWWRLEVKVTPRKTPIEADDCFVCAEEPYSSYWAGWSCFRPPNRRGDSRLPLEPFKSEQAAAKWLDAAGEDYWESGAFLTAGILTEEFGISQHMAASTVRRSARYTLGVCPAVKGGKSAFKAAFDSLWNSDEVRSLLDQTRRRTIAFTWFGNDVPVKISPEVADEGQTVMMTAIHQALAGPADDSEELIGKPVFTLVNRIYRDHLNNLNRRAHLNTTALEDPEGAAKRD